MEKMKINMKSMERGVWGKTPVLSHSSSARLAPLLFLLLVFVTLVGCSLFRGNPLAENRGAVVLVFDTRTAGDLKKLRHLLSAYDARATVFAGGQITRGLALALSDLESDGCAIGLSGLKGVNPQTYGLMYGQQKYFQDEIVTQVLDARRYDLNPRCFLLPSLSQAKGETLKLPSFLIDKGFNRVIHMMPDNLPPRAKPASELTSPVLHAYQMTTNVFDRVQIASLVKHNEILVVTPNRQVLPDLLAEARACGVPFATVADLKVEK